MDDALESDRCARMLRALAERDRLRIVQCLRARPKNVGEIAEELKAEIANVSHHLGVLRNAGLVQSEREGRFIVYRLHPTVFHAAEDGKQEHLDFGCCRLDLPSDAADQ